VSQVVRLGYTLNGRLLRPASVVVSSGPAKPEEAKS
jgi:molecular chaperone GrpE